MTEITHRTVLAACALALHPAPGRTQVTSAGLAALLPHIRNGELRAIAVGGCGPPAEFATFIAQQQKVWNGIVLRAAIKPYGTAMVPSRVTRLRIAAAAGPCSLRAG